MTKKATQLKEEPLTDIIERVALTNANVQNVKDDQLNALNDRCQQMQENMEDAYRVLQQRAAQLKAAMAEVTKAEKANTEARAAREVYRTVVYAG